MMDQRKMFYNTALSQTISTCGRYLFVGNTYGDVFVLSVRQLSLKNDDDFSIEAISHSSAAPLQVFTVDPNVKINSLEFHNNCLVIGTIGTIMGYKWDDENFVLTKKTWEIKIPTPPDSTEPCDINFMCLEKGSDTLFAGCGDNYVYSINLDEGIIERTFTGHSDYVHCVAAWENRVFSASEDGSILFWDVRESKPIEKLEPYKNEQLCRPKFGKWQGTVSVTDDWLVCGGGPSSSMWHLRSLECTNVLSFPNATHCSSFADDSIFIAGEHSHLHQYSFNGEITAEIPVSGPAAYSVVWQNEPIKIMSIAGASNALDICSNFNFKDMVVNLYNIAKK